MIKPVLSNHKKLGWCGIIYGKPGVGKSSLLSTNPKAVFVGTEHNSLLNCQTHPENPAKTYTEFLNHFKWADSLPSDVCDTIVVDTISEVEILMMRDFLKADQNLNTALGGYGAGREHLKKMYSDFFKDHLNPAKLNGKNVVFISRLLKLEETDEETGSTYTRTYPQIEKNKSYEMFAGEMDFIFSIKPISPTKTGELRTSGYNIHTYPSAGSDAKNRFNLSPLYFVPYTQDRKKISNLQRTTWNNIVNDINSYYLQLSPTPIEKAIEEKKEKKPKPVVKKKDPPKQETGADVKEHLVNSIIEAATKLKDKGVNVTIHPREKLLIQKEETLLKFKTFYNKKLSEVE